MTTRTSEINREPQQPALPSSKAMGAGKAAALEALERLKGGSEADQLAILEKLYLRGLLAALRIENAAKAGKRFVPAPPRYDRVYVEGMAWLNTL